MAQQSSAFPGTNCSMFPKIKYWPLRRQIFAEQGMGWQWDFHQELGYCKDSETQKKIIFLLKDCFLQQPQVGLIQWHFSCNFLWKYTGRKPSAAFCANIHATVMPAHQQLKPKIKTLKLEKEGINVLHTCSCCNTCLRFTNVLTIMANKGTDKLCLTQLQSHQDAPLLMPNQFCQY